MDIRELPRLVFNQRVVGKMNPVKSETLHGQGEALIGRTANSMWLRWENSGTLEGYCTDTRVDVFSSEWSAANYFEYRSDCFGGITASISYGAQCIYHDSCSLIASRLAARLGPIAGDITEFELIMRELTDVIALANKLLASPSVEHEVTCRTRQAELRSAITAIGQL